MKNDKKAVIIFGTRPELLKLIPIIYELKINSNFEITIINTGQHHDMLNNLLSQFKITPDYNLNIMKDNQQPLDIISQSIPMLSEILSSINPDIVIVQGDTASAYSGAIVAFHLKIKIAHVEAGLRTYCNDEPFPEEAYRRSISIISNFNFVPTKRAEDNLLKENIASKTISLVGNTIVDMQLLVLNAFHNYSNKLLNTVLNSAKKTALITIHRRENQGDKLHEICLSLKDIAYNHPDITFIFPVHKNPNVADIVKTYLTNISNILLIEPIDYPDLQLLMKSCSVILTDSGGIQEEACLYKKPVMILRNHTEREESIEYGIASLVGNNKEGIIKAFSELCKNDFSISINSSINPYGDGKASEKIVNILKTSL